MVQSLNGIYVYIDRYNNVNGVKTSGVIEWNINNLNSDNCKT